MFDEIAALQQEFKLKRTQVENTVKLIDEGKFVMLTISLVYAFVTCFYIGFMIGIFSAIYFVIVFIVAMLGFIPIFLPLLAVLVTVAGMKLAMPALQSRLPNAAAYSQEAQG